MLTTELGGPSVVDERQPARPLVLHPAAVPLHPRVGRHLRLHLLLLIPFMHLTDTHTHEEQLHSQILQFTELQLMLDDSFSSVLRRNLV